MLQLLLDDEDVMNLLEAGSSKEVDKASFPEESHEHASTEFTEGSDITPPVEETNVAQSTEEGYVTDVESLNNLKIGVAGKHKADNYKHETVGDKPWEESATEKFKEIN